MSRIGNAPISIPDKVEINVAKNNLVTVKGPKGELTQKVDPDLTVKVEDGEVFIERSSDIQRIRSQHGLYRSLLNNMVQGVSEGYTIELELVGVGYRASVTGQLLELALGYSHPIMFAVPGEVQVTTEAEKGKAPLVRLQSHDKQLLGQVAAKIRAFRKPEPYKGKGVRFKGEILRRKAGKTASK